MSDPPLPDAPRERAILDEIFALTAELEDPNLTKTRWVELLDRAGVLVDELGSPEFMEPFLRLGYGHRWELPEHWKPDEE